MSKTLVFVISFSLIMLTATLTLILNSGQEREPSKKELDIVINQAKFIFHQTKLKGVDFAEGPCLSNALMEGWVLDIVHNPRQTVDDLPQNQCSAILEGRARHFVELDLEGNFVRAK